LVGATPDTGRFLWRMENQNDESDAIAPAQSLSAAHTTAATAERAYFHKRSRPSYVLYVISGSSTGMLQHIKIIYVLEEENPGDSS
jgi:4-aminobutyrate aminotransferase-like enzyme